MRRELAFLALMIFLTGFAAAQSADGTTSPVKVEGWEKSSEAIENCEPESPCVENDSFSAKIVHTSDGDYVRMWSGSTGFCGVARLSKTFKANKDYRFINMDLKAKQDMWGNSFWMKVKVNGETLKKFSKEGDKPRPETWPWLGYSHQINGSRANVTLIIGDKSQKNCNMRDHSKKLLLHNVSFSNSMRYGSTYPVSGKTASETETRTPDRFKDAPPSAKGRTSPEGENSSPPINILETLIAMVSALF